MPTYEAPGVFIEETSFRAKSIAPQPSAVTAFVGPTLTAPDDPGQMPMLTSLQAFEHHYGGLDDLGGAGAETTNFIAHAANAFFNNGGKRLYVSPTPAEASLDDYTVAIARLNEEPDIELVAAPGASALALDLAAQVTRALVDHVEADGRRFAVLDAPPGASLTDVQTFRTAYDSKRAAIYYPWILVADPRPGRAGVKLALPPSGFICGIYDRAGQDSPPWKAPANEIVRGAIGLETELNFAEQAVLNPLGINCIRVLAGRGIRVWGARTISSDPEFRYVNISRLWSYIQRSLDQGLAWAAFEPNSEPLWANIRSVTADFLYPLWRDGALQGSKPEDAFFVRCDRSTMTAADIAAGRLICLVGIAVIKPSEFMIVRVGQLTAEATG